METLKKLVDKVVMVLIGAVIALLGYLTVANRLSNEILLPVLAIVGVVCLIMTLILAAILFARLGMADKTQALALPEGSVRAVIALALIVLFAIITVFIYGSLVSGDLRRVSGLTYEAAKTMSEAASRQDSSIEIVFIEPPLGHEQSTSDPGTSDMTSTDTGTTDTVTTDNLPPASKVPKSKKAPIKGPSEGPFEIGYRSRVSRDAADFAKQLMTLLGTLVTAVASFYFGSRTVAAAMDTAATASPSILSVTPAQALMGTKQVQVTIVGSGLKGTKSVKLANTTDQPIEGTVVQKSDCAVVCTFDMPGTAGKWELVVTGEGEPIRKPFDVKELNP